MVKFTQLTTSPKRLRASASRAGTDEDTQQQKEIRMSEVIRYSKSGSICIVWDKTTNEAVRCPTQDDMDRLPVGKDLTAAEIATLPD